MRIRLSNIPSLRRRCPMHAAGVFFLTCVVSSAAFAQTPAPPAPGAANDQVSRLLEQRRQLAFGSKLHFRERNQTRVLRRIESEIREGRFLNACRHLQRWIDVDDDQFIFMENRQTPTGLRNAAAELLSGMNREGRDRYERLFGAIANELLRDADRTIDVAVYRTVVRRYFHTRAGFDAANRLARLAFARGDYASAAAIWMRTRRDSQHAKRIPRTTKLSLAVALRHLGRSKQSDAVLKEVVGTRMPIAGRLESPNDWFRRESARMKAKTTNADWRMPLGNPQGDRFVSVTAPFPRPVWTQQYSIRTNGPLEKAFQQWEARQSAAVMSKAVANSAIVVGDLVIVRDANGIRVLDLADGKTVWTYQPITTLAKSAGQFRAGAAKNSTDLFASSTVTKLFDLQNAYASNSTLGTLTSDGNHVFLIDDFKLGVIPAGYPQLRFRGSRLQGTVDLSQRTNRLIALKLHDDHTPAKSRVPVWTVGTVPDPTKSPTSLSNHFFLGPPLPVEGKLYAVTESKQRLHLACLDAATGRLLWLQKLAIADTPIETDFPRAVRACTPSYADGVVVCPTNTGLLIAADAATGSLLWAVDCGNRVAPSSRSGFPSAPRIHNGRVTFLPWVSSRVLCVDLWTGRTIWNTDRNDGEYIAAVDDERIVVVGRQRTRGLSLADGRELWASRLGMPSGRALQVNRRVLIPLESGEVVTVDMATGKPVGQAVRGSRFTATSLSDQSDAKGKWRPGNLIAAGGLILSSEPRQLRVFKSAATVLAQAQSELRRDSESTLKRLRVAEVQLILGDMPVAEEHLTAVMKLSRSNSERDRAETMLRELLYVRLTNEPTGTAELLDRLQPLAKSPKQRGRYLVRRAEFELSRNNFNGVLTATRQFATLDLKGLFPMPHDATHLVSAASWVPDIIGRVRTRFGPTALKKIAIQVDDARQKALTSTGLTQIERFLSIYRDWPQAAGVRSELARRLIARGQYQHAEFLLMTNRRDANELVRTTATRNLAALWNRRGLTVKAQVLRGATSLRRKRTIRRVTVRSRRWMGTDPSLAKTLGNFRQRFLTPHDSPFYLLDRGDTVDRRLAVVDRTTAVEVGSIVIPSRHSYPMLSRHAHIGHFFSLGAAGEAHGVSLLEHDLGKPLWKAVPHGFGTRADLLNVGPAGTTFCSFQARGTVIVVDPATGRLLWQRDGLEPGAGMIGDPYSGFFGDDRVLVLFAADRKYYTVYDTQTGLELRRGRLDISSDFVRRIFGRKLCYVTRVGRVTKLRIWDPLTDTHSLDVSFLGPLHSTSTDEGELVVMLPENRLLVFDVERGATVLNTRFEATAIANLTYLRAFRQGGRLVVNLQRVGPVPTTQFSFYASDAFVAAEHVRGDLHVFDLKIGRRLWTRTVPQRSILKMDNRESPFLIFVSRTRERRDGGRHSMRVEVVDASNGETLGVNNNIQPDRILHVTVNRDCTRVKLHGEKSTIEIDAISLPDENRVKRTAF